MGRSKKTRVKLLLDKTFQKHMNLKNIRMQSRDLLPQHAIEENQVGKKCLHFLM